MIRTIAVIGAGAIGSFFLKGLTAAGDLQVFAVAEGDRKRRLESDGIFLNGEVLPLKVQTPEESKGADLIIVCVKYGSLPGILQDIETIADSHTIILSPMNGIDSEEIIARRMGRQHILHSMMVIAAERKANQIIYNEGVEPFVHYGRAEGYGTEEDLQALQELLARTGLNSRFHDRIITTIWNKFAINISTNIAQAIIGCGYGAYRTSPYMYKLGKKLSDEVLEVAKARGVVCTFDFEKHIKTRQTSEKARFSTLQDLMAGRHTEVDMFCGTVMRLGKEMGIPTPYNEFAYLAIKALEEKNDGKMIS